jgi:hypothetical protein
MITVLQMVNPLVGPFYFLVHLLLPPEPGHRVVLSNAKPITFRTVICACHPNMIRGFGQKRQLKVAVREAGATQGRLRGGKLLGGAHLVAVAFQNLSWSEK